MHSDAYRINSFVFVLSRHRWYNKNITRGEAEELLMNEVKTTSVFKDSALICLCIQLSFIRKKKNKKHTHTHQTIFQMMISRMLIVHAPLLRRCQPQRSHICRINANAPAHSQSDVTWAMKNVSQPQCFLQC